MGIMHGDLRGVITSPQLSPIMLKHFSFSGQDNILVSDDETVQITDVTLFPLRDEWSAASPQRKGGPERWMAPELFHSLNPTPATDIFAFGFVCIEVGAIAYNIGLTHTLSRYSQARFTSLICPTH